LPNARRDLIATNAPPEATTIKPRMVEPIPPSRRTRWRGGLLCRRSDRSRCCGQRGGGGRIRLRLVAAPAQGSEPRDEALDVSVLPARHPQPAAGGVDRPPLGIRETLQVAAEIVAQGEQLVLAAIEVGGAFHRSQPDAGRRMRVR